MQSFVPENCYNYNINSKVVQLIPKFNLDTIYLYLSTDWQCLLYVCSTSSSADLFCISVDPVAIIEAFRI